MSDSSAVVPPPDTLVCASLSDAGRVRAENQDAAEVVQNTSGERLLIVADGMGGHLGGETASRMCLDLVERCFREPHGSPEERLRRGLVLANEEIYSHALGNPELRGMGTTAVALLFSAAGAWVAWVGDSRAYRLRAGTLEPLTRDHSLMAEWIGLGVLTAEAAETHPRRHELTRALGQSPDVVVDVASVELRPGDRFLLCSDGLHGYVPERALRSVLGEGTPEDCARTLVERANANGGSDNVSVIVAALPETVVASAPPPEPEDIEPIEIAPPPEPVAPKLDELEAPVFANDFEPPPELAPLPAPPPPASAPEPAGSFSFGEISFGDVLSPEEPGAAAEPALAEAEPEPAPAVEPEPAPEPAPRYVAQLDPPPPREIRIPLMTPVRARRGLDARSMAIGVAATLLVAALFGAAWHYTGSRRAPEPAPVVPAPQARRVAPTPAPAPVPAPKPVPAPVAPVAPPRPEIAEIEHTHFAKLPPPAPAPVTPPPRPAATPPAAPAAAPEPAELATSRGFELPPPVTRFVDDWLRAVSTHDASRLAALGLRGAPDDFAGSFATRDGFKLVDASLDEERSNAGRYFVRLVVSYAFRDSTGRFRTQDEERWILRDVGGALRYEGRWQQ